MLTKKQIEDVRTTLPARNADERNRVSVLLANYEAWAGKRGCETLASRIEAQIKPFIPVGLYLQWMDGGGQQPARPARHTRSPFNAIRVRGVRAS